jgi:long-chain acyl-CoA synthetase
MEECTGLESVVPGEDDIAIQLFTSGTTGAPKAVLHTHQGLIFFMAMFGYTYMHSSPRVCAPQDDVVLCILPLYHISGMTTLYGLVSGRKTILLDKFDMYEFLGAIEEHHVTKTTVPSTVIEWMADFDKLSDYDLSSLATVSYGGNSLTHNTINVITKKLNCVLGQAYGSTECLIVSVLGGDNLTVDPAKGDLRAYSLGKAMIGAETRVVDDAGEICPAGVEGEIIARSPAMMQGYFGNDVCDSAIDAKGWFRTEDIGYTDENGFLYLTGRKKDIIISGSENIYPKEIENCISKLEKHVREVAVVGIPNKKWGETPAAFVVLNENSDLSEKELLEHCRASIAHYKCPTKVIFTSVLPRDTLGKINKDTLREMLDKFLDES